MLASVLPSVKLPPGSNL